MDASVHTDVTEQRPEHDWEKSKQPPANAQWFYPLKSEDSRNAFRPGQGANSSFPKSEPSAPSVPNRDSTRSVYALTGNANSGTQARPQDGFGSLRIDRAQENRTGFDPHDTGVPPTLTEPVAGGFSTPFRKKPGALSETSDPFSSPFAATAYSSPLPPAKVRPGKGQALAGPAHLVRSPKAPAKKKR